MFQDELRSVRVLQFNQDHELFGERNEDDNREYVLPIKVKIIKKELGVNIARTRYQ